MRADFLMEMAVRRREGARTGITSVCSAHPVVLEAALREAQRTGVPALIEATCNQVNQEGGYTGMTPAAFRRMVERIAAETGIDETGFILGGDHLGPNPWKHLPSDEAMERAAEMVRGYIAAGFAKIHLDASMACLGDGPALPDAVIAERAATLAEAAEEASRRIGGPSPVYVIGTEVPTPGGTPQAHETMSVTTPQATRDTVAIHRQAFHRHNLESAFDRIVAVVVQPGVEFGGEDVAIYDPEAARPLVAALPDLGGLVFEAHSTDYQPGRSLSDLVRDGFAILKVGPHLTFALREALYGLDLIAAELDGERPRLRADMEAVMLRDARYWQAYCHGAAHQQRVQRHFSYFDRIRYYWATPEATASVENLMRRLGDQPIPSALVSQYIGTLACHRPPGSAGLNARSLLQASIGSVLCNYSKACNPRP
jgi:D-tagatose-bisphosphate aldolase class II non-catalytic subunit